MSVRDAIPAALRDLTQWVVWKAEQRDGKATKVLYDPRKGTRASSTDPDTWCDFATAASANGDWDGIGFVFAPDDPYCGVDLDRCYRDGELHPDAAEIVMRLDSYAERSPSGTGVHVIVDARLQGKGRRTRKTPWGGDIEVYDRARYFTVTGDVLDGPSTVQSRQAELDQMVSRLLPPPSPNGKQPPPTTPVALDDRELLERARGAKNGAKFDALWRGDTAGYASPSEADLALCNMLAFWTGRDPERMDRMFRASGLVREKWDRGDYRRGCIDRAISNCRDVYEPQRNSGAIPESDDPRADLEELLGLDAEEVNVVAVRMWGEGSSASLDIELSNEETLRFKSLREMVRPQALAAELVACAGATPKLDQARAVRAVKLARKIAERTRTVIEDNNSVDWGLEFLQDAEVIDFTLDDQRERWGAFSQLANRNPWAHARDQGSEFAKACIVLRDVTGARLVRTEWFLKHVRGQQPIETKTTVNDRMVRVGWERRGGQGRIKATEPDGTRELIWTFWVVPAGWAGDGK
jgi:hypothetical protein